MDSIIEFKMIDDTLERMIRYIGVIDLISILLSLIIIYFIVSLSVIIMSFLSK